jgi:hypothetical protein
LEEGVECATFVDLEGADQGKAEEILIEDPGLLGISATIRVVVKPLDHVILRSHLIAPKISPVRVC